MLTKQEMMAELLALSQPAPKPKPKSAEAKAAERFDLKRKPLDRKVEDAAAHNRDVIAGLRAERPSGMSEEEEKACAWQQIYDRAWEDTLAHRAELEELANPDPIEAYSRSLYGVRR